MIVAKDIINDECVILDKFKERAPGSDRHCKDVMILCNSIANYIGTSINRDNLVAAARIHDVGKMNYPLAFSENQDSDKNIHDDLDPGTSYQIITRHVGDGVLKLIQYDVDPDIIKIVSEHHGDSVLKAIYKKAADGGESVLKDNYRYKSTKPSSVESCILMICDVVESACRSIYTKDKDNFDVENVVNDLIDGLIDDQQLDVLTIGDIRAIKTSILKEIESVYHKRVSYETAD